MIKQYLALKIIESNSYDFIPHQSFVGIDFNNGYPYCTSILDCEKWAVNQIGYNNIIQYKEMFKDQNFEVCLIEVKQTNFSPEQIESIVNN